MDESEMRLYSGMKDMEFKYLGEHIRELGLIRIYVMIAAISLLSIALMMLVGMFFK